MFRRSGHRRPSIGEDPHAGSRLACRSDNGTTNAPETARIIVLLEHRQAGDRFNPHRTGLAVLDRDGVAVIVVEIIADLDRPVASALLTLARQQVVLPRRQAQPEAALLDRHDLVAGTLEAAGGVAIDIEVDPLQGLVAVGDLAADGGRPVLRRRLVGYAHQVETDVGVGAFGHLHRGAAVVAKMPARLRFSLVVACRQIVAARRQVEPVGAVLGRRRRNGHRRSGGDVGDRLVGADAHLRNQFAAPGDPALDSGCGQGLAGQQQGKYRDKEKSLRHSSFSPSHAWPRNRSAGRGSRARSGPGPSGRTFRPPRTGAYHGRRR